MAVYALNLFDLADNDDYLAYSRRSPAAVARHGGQVVALGRGGSQAPEHDGGVPPRDMIVLVEWPSHEALRAFLDDPDTADLHPLREGGTSSYLWWTFDKLEDLRHLKGRLR